jgi:hypothetical protein
VVEMIVQWLMQQRMTQPTDEAEPHTKKNVDICFKNAAASLPPIAHGFESTCAVGAMHGGMERVCTMWLINGRGEAES